MPRPPDLDPHYSPTRPPHVRRRLSLNAHLERPAPVFRAGSSSRAISPLSMAILPEARDHSQRALVRDYRRFLAFQLRLSMFLAPPLLRIIHMSPDEALIKHICFVSTPPILPILPAVFRESPRNFAFRPIRMHVFPAIVRRRPSHLAFSHAASQGFASCSDRLLLLHSRR